MDSFPTIRMSGVDRVRETLFSSHCSESSQCTARARAAVAEGSRRRAVPERSGHCPGEVTLVGRPAAGRFQASMSRIKFQGAPGGCWCHPARQAGINECLDHGRESGMGGDERGQDADPAVHAVRVRDVLQLDGLRALLGALRTCRWAGVVHPYICALTCMVPTLTGRRFILVVPIGGALPNIACDGAARLAAEP
jgi:hypothetical protein